MEVRDAMIRMMAALAMIYLALFGCGRERVLDEDSAHWARISVLAGDTAVPLAVPHGSEYEKQRDLRPVESSARAQDQEQ
jgi:hypothetical protein